MAVNKDSNAYTITFAIILVIIVGGLLAFIANGLKPLQDENLKNEKKQYILNCLPGNKLISRDQAGTQFANFVKERVILDYNGEELANTFMGSDQSLDDKNPNDEEEEAGEGGLAGGGNQNQQEGLVDGGNQNQQEGLVKLRTL